MPCFTAQHHASVIYIVAQCLSVDPSITSRYCTRMAKCGIRQTTRHNSQGL